MAYLGFSPPEPFDFQRPDDWMKWKRRFECFRLASGLAKEDEARQVSALLYCMGDQADSALTSTKITTEDRLKYDSVMSKFDEYFKVRRIVILERARFNQRNQLQGRRNCHATDGPPKMGPPGPSVANYVAMGGPPGPSTAAIDGLPGPSVAP